MRSACALATTKRLLDEATGRPHDLRGAAAISAASSPLWRGTRRHPRLRRKASAGLGEVKDRGENAMTRQSA